jgi:hypothetical protein
LAAGAVPDTRILWAFDTNTGWEKALFFRAQAEFMRTECQRG